jgi:RHS repeat-associated protein
VGLSRNVPYPLPSPAVGFQYSYDQGSEKTQQVFTAAGYAPTGNYINYSYDKIGQLTKAQGFEPGGTTPRLQEQFGYGYDQAWNLNRRTNNALVQAFNVNTLNELTTTTNSGMLTVAGTSTEPKGGMSSWGSPSGVTNVSVSGTGLSSGTANLYLDGSWARTNATLANGNNTYTAIAQDTYLRLSTNSITVNLPATNNYSYDLNGNLLSDGTRYFAFDDENQLVSVWVTNVWREDYIYDGLLRRRITRDYAWQSSSWAKTNEVRYVYDGQMVVQERDINNLPVVTYTRGNDLSGTLQGAGGIGGLLARTVNSQMLIGAPFASAYYFCDAMGNISGLVYTNGLMAAQYTYDPFGNILTMSGPLASANTYRFSSKEWNDKPGTYYYLYRFYDPMLQRWLNRDPIQERGRFNLYAFISNVAVNAIDAFGLCDQVPNLLAPYPKYDPNAPNMLRPSDLWPPQMPPLFEPKPDTNPLHFVNAAAKGLFKNTPLGDTLKQWGNNVANDLGINSSQLGKGEQLGLEAACAAGEYGFGKSVSLNYNLTPKVSVGFSISSSGPGFTKPSACMGTVKVNF